MPLKLIVSGKDRIIMSNGVIIEVLSVGKRVTLSFDAPKDIKIHAIFNDPSKQFKNLRNSAEKQPSPEEQQAERVRRLTEGKHREK